MENVVLVIHLILALGLIAIVLIQRSEGGGLGMGGGGGGTGRSGRPASTPMAKVTWFFAIGFVITSISLTVIAARNANSDSVIERLGTDAPAASESLTPAPAGLEGNLLPPAASDEPATPPAAE
ncbi:MAG: preprotein translocase subunit SecG [Proteobacteria bacterium]|nr:preprotein translocase subunit SecG [Pseudomonadota bacterium]